MEERPLATTLYSLSHEIPGRRERRDAERHLTLFRVGSLTVGDRRELCLIKNISGGGMMIRAYSRLEPGMKLSIELKHGQDVRGTVSWVESESAGIGFENQIDVVELLSATAESPTPRMPRIELQCMVSVRQGAKIYGMLARDISQGGVKLESDRPLAVGSEAVVTMPGLSPQPGTVRWSEFGCYGITFHRLLALNDLVRWLQDQRELLPRSATG